MSNRTLVLSFVLVAVGGVGGSAQTTTAPSPNAAQNISATGNAENGKRVYTSDSCSACHGTVGQGGREGARIAPDPPPLATITRYIRRPSGQMPPYTSKVLSDQEIADIYAYLKTIPAAPSAKNIPLLNQ